MRDLAKAPNAAKAAAQPSQRAMNAAKRMGLNFGPDGKPKPMTPGEYFSEGFRMYLQSPETQAQLKQRDPKLFARLHSILGTR